MNPAIPKTELRPSTQPRKVVFGGSRLIALTLMLLVVHAGGQSATTSAAPDQLLLLQAEKGDPNAIYALGMKYGGEDKSPANTIAAYMYLHIAAELGESKALWPRHDVAALMTQENVQEAQRRARKFMETNATVSALIAKRAGALPAAENPVKHKADLTRNLFLALAMKEAPGCLIVHKVIPDAGWKRVQYLAINQNAEPRLVLDSVEKDSGEIEWMRVPWMDRIVKAKLSYGREVTLVEFRTGPDSVGVYDLDSGGAWDSEDPFRLATLDGKPIVITKNTGIIRNPDLWFGRQRTVGVTPFELFLIDSCGFSRRTADIFDVTDTGDFTKLAVPISLFAMYELARFAKRRKSAKTETGDGARS